jgi:enamine deaminase RidA (YjgF/YER057c/UK114 family)
MSALLGESRHDTVADIVVIDREPAVAPPDAVRRWRAGRKRGRRASGAGPKRSAASEVFQPGRDFEAVRLHACRRGHRSRPHRLHRGQLGWDGSGKRAGEPGDFRAQATQVFENLQTALRSAGAGFEHVVKLNAYTTSMANMPVFREVRNKYITGTPPASTAVEISKLARPDALLEVEVVAVVAS